MQKSYVKPEDYFFYDNFHFDETAKRVLESSQNRLRNLDIIHYISTSFEEKLETRKEKLEKSIQDWIKHCIRFFDIDIWNPNHIWLLNNCLKDVRRKYRLDKSLYDTVTNDYAMILLDLGYSDRSLEVRHWRKPVDLI